MLRGRGLPPDEEPDDFDDLDDDADAEDEDSADEDDEDEDDEIAGVGGDLDAGDDSDETDDDEDELPATTVFVATATPLEVSVSPLPDERAPDGVCLAARIDGRLVARCAMPGESIERLVALKLFEEPVLVGPAARLTEGSEPDEPWKASVPSFEEGEHEDGDDGDGSGLAAILLGHIVRFTSDRKHPEDLAQEAVDILQRVVAGAPMPDAATKAIDDLLDSL